jgi:uncharacterized MnhB-related membrane protein
MILELLIGTAVILSIAAAEKKDLIHAVIILGSADAVLAVTFYFLAAPDIAITQAAVIACLSTFIYILAIRKTRRME